MSEASWKDLLLSHHLVLSSRDMLFCALTNHYINRKPDEVKGHTSGKKYKKALEQCESVCVVCRDMDSPSEERKPGVKLVDIG